MAEIFWSVHVSGFLPLPQSQFPHRGYQKRLERLGLRSGRFLGASWASALAPALAALELSQGVWACAIDAPWLALGRARAVRAGKLFHSVGQLFNSIQ